MAGCIFSGYLLRLCFPQPGLWLLTWIALVPWWRSLNGVDGFGRFCLSGVAGLVFFGSALFWLTDQTWVGYTACVLYCAFFFAGFGWLGPAAEDAHGFIRVLRPACVWVVLEYFRGAGFPGGGWAGIGYSQAPFLPLIHIASWVGVWGVSFCVVTVNIGIAELTLNAGMRFRTKVGIAILGGVLGCMILSGAVLLQAKREETSSEHLKILAIQANIPPQDKWLDLSPDWVLSRYVQQTSLALSERSKEKEPIDLILWPETALPEDPSQEMPLGIRLQRFVSLIQIPLLTGTIRWAYGPWGELGDFYYNAAYLYSRDGALLGWVAKRHLIPFVEYLPLEKHFRILRQVFTHHGYYVPGGEDGMLAGLGLLICVEDWLPSLARRRVAQGACALVVLTDDGWFHGPDELLQHLQGSVLRAVETGRAVVRVANTGVSCLILPSGKIQKIIRNDTAGSLSVNLPLYHGRTLYQNMGDVWVGLCGLLWGLSAALDRFRARA